MKLLGDVSDGGMTVQDMLPQNTAPWQVDCFQLNEFEKWQVQERLFLEQVVGPPGERREHPYLQR